jgi:hypothetical protein
VKSQHFFAPLQKVFAQGADREFYASCSHELNQVGTFVLPQCTGIDQSQLHSGHLHPLGEVHAVEPIAKTAELEDVVLAR